MGHWLNRLSYWPNSKAKFEFFGPVVWALFQLTIVVMLTLKIVLCYIFYKSPPKVKLSYKSNTVLNCARQSSSGSCDFSQSLIEF